MWPARRDSLPAFTRVPRVNTRTDRFDGMYRASLQGHRYRHSNNFRSNRANERKRDVRDSRGETGQHLIVFTQCRSGESRHRVRKSRLPRFHGIPSVQDPLNSMKMAVWV